MGTITTKDGVEIFYKDWGRGQPIVFHHGWPLSCDDWDTQMLFFLHHGYRVVGIDRRGHGRSSQGWEGHDLDHYAADAAAVWSTSTCATPFTSAIPPAAAKSPATLPGTAKGASPRRC
jgi:non-heme chloroperoxidase